MNIIFEWQNNILRTDAASESNIVFATSLAPLKSQIVSPYHPGDMLLYSPACISSNKPF